MAGRKRRVGAKQQRDGVAMVIQALQAITETEALPGVNLFAEDFHNIINRLKDDVFRLAVVGEFSSGKSTFLNALIKKDILKHGAKETTAAITEIQKQADIQQADVFDVYYADGKKEENIVIGLLEEYTATSSGAYRVAQEIQRVVIKTNAIDIESNICFVDTPGLNGLADHHRERTLEQIKNSHACIYLLQVRGLGQSDIEFIRFISKYQHNIIFVQNFIDELKELEGETVETKLAEQKRLLEDKVFNDIPQVHYELVGISARKALIAREQDITKYEGEDLTDELRERLYKESCFDTLLDAVAKLIQNNEKGLVQRRETAAVALDLVNQLQQIVSFHKEQEEEEWRNSTEGKRQEKYQRLKEELLKSKDKYLANIANFVDSESDDIRKSVNKKIADGMQQILEAAKEELEAIDKIEVFEEYVKRNEMAQFLYGHIADLNKNCNNHTSRSFENLLCNAIVRIERYTGNQAGSSNMSIKEFYTDPCNPGYQNQFSQEENEISKLEHRLADKKAQLEINEEKRGQWQSEIGELEEAIQAIERKKKNVENEKQRVIARLGAKPEAVTRYRDEPYYKYRGGLGIMDALFGPIKRTRRVSYLDNAEQQDWINKKVALETEYRRKQDAINAQARLLSQKKEACMDDIVYLDRIDPKKQREVEQMQALIQSKIEYVNAKREMAKKEYLRNLKNALTARVHSYLIDEEVCLVAEFDKSVMESRQEIHSHTRKLFEFSFEERIKTLSRLISEKDEINTSIKTEQMKKLITNTKAVLEDYICQSSETQS